MSHIALTNEVMTASPTIHVESYRRISYTRTSTTEMQSTRRKTNTPHLPLLALAAAFDVHDLIVMPAVLLQLPLQTRQCPHRLCTRVSLRAILHRYAFLHTKFAATGQTPGRGPPDRRYGGTRPADRLTQNREEFLRPKKLQGGGKDGEGARRTASVLAPDGLSLN